MVWRREDPFLTLSRVDAQQINMPVIIISVFPFMLVGAYIYEVLSFDQIRAIQVKDHLPLAMQPTDRKKS